MKLLGSITARIIRYVGEQEVNAGPRESPISTSPMVPLRVAPLPIPLFEAMLSFRIIGILVQSVGNRKVRPMKNMSVAAIVVQTSCGI